MKRNQQANERSDTRSLSRRRLLGGLGTAALVGAGRFDALPADWADPVRSAAARRIYLWFLHEKLAAGDGDSEDYFGGAVALSARDTAIVGAAGDEVQNEDNAGSAYVFARSGWNWNQQTKLTPTSGDADDVFGTSVALARNGTTALVGAKHDEDPNGSYAGAAYVFTKSSGSWSQQQRLSASSGDTWDTFGASVALNANGDTALVGAPADDVANESDAGSAYVFGRSGGNWNQQTRLTATNGDYNDWFGGSVALDGNGDTALVGAYRDEPNGNWAGSAYVFTRSGGSWSQQTKLTATNGDDRDVFGYSVALNRSGDIALLGAPLDEDPNGNKAGSAYVFARSGGTWTRQAKLTPNAGDANDKFGGAVALDEDGDVALVGAHQDEDPNGPEAGATYVFTRSGVNWSQQAKLDAPDGDDEDGFGSSVGLDWTGCTALVGASGDEDPNGADAGSAYVFGSIVFFIPLWPPYLGEEIRFDASYSTLSMERAGIEAYEWDLNGDGEYEEVTEEPEVTHVFERAGEHTVSLRLRSEDGEVSRPTSRRVYVRRRIEIDIRPGDEENWIEPESEEVVPVAVLASSALEDLERVDPTTARFGPADRVSLDELGAPYGGPRPVEVDREDVGGDGREDLLLWFRQDDIGFDPEDTTGKFVALTEDGVPLVGTDSVIVDS